MGHLPPTQRSAPSQNVRFVQTVQRALFNPETYHPCWHRSSTGRNPSHYHVREGTMTVQATVYSGCGVGERITPPISVALVAAILGGSPLPVVAEDAVQPTRCIRMLRVTGVAQDDVLFLRAFPYVPDSPEPDNRVIGIPPEARRIQELSGGQGERGHIRYLGHQG